MQSKHRKPHQQSNFDKMLPRDNKMFFINEGMNLQPKQEKSMLQRLTEMDIDPRKFRKMKYHSQNGSLSFNESYTTESKKVTLENKILQGFYKSCLDDASNDD